MLSLTKPNVFPPGGFAYRQRETGQEFKGNDQLKAQAKRVVAHRQGNHLARATLLEAMEDIMAAVCARHPALCTDLQPKSFSLQTPVRPRSIAPLRAAVPAPERSVPAPVRQVKKCGSCGGRKAVR